MEYLVRPSIHGVRADIKALKEGHVDTADIIYMRRRSAAARLGLIPTINLVANFIMYHDYFPALQMVPHLCSGFYQNNDRAPVASLIYHLQFKDVPPEPQDKIVISFSYLKLLKAAQEFFEKIKWKFTNETCSNLLEIALGENVPFRHEKVKMHSALEHSGLLALAQAFASFIYKFQRLPNHNHIADVEELDITPLKSYEQEYATFLVTAADKIIYYANDELAGYLQSLYNEITLLKEMKSKLRKQEAGLL
jgi:hypothetical protein